MVYQDSWHLAPSALKWISKFEILLAKIFTLKQKTNHTLPATKEKKQILCFQENSLTFFQTTNFVEISNYMFK